MSVKKVRLYIEGMSCVGCQQKIERRLQNTAGVQEARVSYGAGTADVVYDEDIVSLQALRELISRLHYRVLPEREAPKSSFKRTVCLLLIIISLYVLLQQWGVLNFFVPGRLAADGMGYGVLFLVGLLTSVHCLAMCGGINLSQCLQQGREGRTLTPALLYNLGRVASYTAGGFILGCLGMLFGVGSGGFSVFWQGILKIIAGLFMVLMGLNMLGLFPLLRRWAPRLPRFLAVPLARHQASGRGPLVVGFCNGLMPCGPLQSMQLLALAAAEPLAGALSLLCFGLGTMPLMLGFGSLVTLLGRRFSEKFMSAGAVLVTVLGLAMLSQGGSLSGLLLPDSFLALLIFVSMIALALSLPCRRKIYRLLGVAAVCLLMLGAGAVWSIMEEAEQERAALSVQQAVMKDGVQTVSSTLLPGRYPSIAVQEGVPVRWLIEAPPGSVNGCNYKMLLQEYGLEHEFHEGQNVLEFTPSRSGTVQYTCWMGMISGRIFVLKPGQKLEAERLTAPAAGGGCCGGGL